MAKRGRASAVSARGAEGGEQKTASAGASLAAKTRKGGRGTPERGSHTAGRGSDILASPISGVNTVPLEPSTYTLPPPSPDAGPILDMPMVMSIPTGPLKLEKYRLPSVKNAGRDAEGKVIPHHRSEEIAKAVAMYASRGASENFICVMVNIRPGQLKEHYANELEHSAELANLEVAGAAFEMAKSQQSEQMTKFWLKARNKWRDTDSSENKDASLFNINIHI